MSNSQNPSDRQDAAADRPAEVAPDRAAEEVHGSTVGASHDDVLARIPDLADDTPAERPHPRRRQRSGRHHRPRTTGSPVGLLAGGALLLLVILVVPLMWKNKASRSSESAEPGAWEMQPPAPGAPLAPAWGGADSSLAGHPSATAGNWPAGTTAPTTVQPESVAPDAWSRSPGVPNWAAPPVTEGAGSPGLPTAGGAAPWPNTTAAAGWSDQPSTGPAASAAATGSPAAAGWKSTDYAGQPNWAPQPAATQPAYGARVPAQVPPLGSGQRPVSPAVGDASGGASPYTGSYRPSQPTGPYANAYRTPQDIGAAQPAAPSIPQPNWGDSSARSQTRANTPAGAVPYGTAGTYDARSGENYGVAGAGAPRPRDPVSVAQRPSFSQPAVPSYNPRTLAATGYYAGPAEPAGGIPAYQGAYPAASPAVAPATGGSGYPPAGYGAAPPPAGGYSATPYATPPAARSGYAGTAYPATPPAATDVSSGYGAAGSVPSSRFDAAATAAPGQPGVARLNGVIEKPNYSASHDLARPSFY